MYKNLLDAVFRWSPAEFCILCHHKNIFKNKLFLSFRGGVFKNHLYFLWFALFGAIFAYELRLFLNILSLKNFLCVSSMKFAQNFAKLLKNLVSINIAMRNIEWLLLRCLSMARGHQSEIQFMKVRVIFSIQLEQNRHLSPIVTHKA